MSLYICVRVRVNLCVRVCMRVRGRGELSFYWFERVNELFGDVERARERGGGSGDEKDRDIDIDREREKRETTSPPLPLPLSGGTQCAVGAQSVWRASAVWVA